MLQGRKYRGTTHFTAIWQSLSDSDKSIADYGASGLHYWSIARSQNRLRKQSVFIPVLSHSIRQLSETFLETFFPSLPLIFN